MSITNDLDLLLVAPGDGAKIYQGLAAEVAAIEPPIWTGLLAEFVRRRGDGVAIVDQTAEGLSPEGIVARAEEEKPRLVAIVVYGQHPSASTQLISMTAEIVAAFRQLRPETKILLIGGHVSALPRRTLEETGADFVCEGEGPKTLEALLAIENLDDPARLGNVPGLWYRDGDRILSTPRAAMIPEAELTTVLSGEAWDLLPMPAYRAHNWHCFENLPARQPYASIYTSLGCPFHCSFCSINAPFGDPAIRCWDPRFVITQIDLLVNQYGVRNLKIADELFVLKERHVEALCDLIIARGYELNIWAYARVDTVKERLLEKLRRAGFRWLCLGIESKSAHVRDGVGKGRYGEAEIRASVDRIRAAGIHVIGNYLFGLPDDSLASMQETLDLAIELNCEMANFYSVMAYPGSRLWDEATAKGTPLPESWRDYAQHAYGQLPLPTEHCTAAEVLSFRDRAWRTYFTNPRYLGMIERTFGREVVEHLERIAAIPLARR